MLHIDMDHRRLFAFNIFNVAQFGSATVVIKCIIPIVQIPMVLSERRSRRCSFDQYSIDRRFEIIGLFPIYRTEIDPERLVWLEAF